MNDLPSAIWRPLRWRDEALCLSIGPEWFFPEAGDNSHKARAVCARCPVQAECLEWAMVNDEQHGIWGGFTTTQRRKLSRRLAA